jgi:hypothetical protein
MVMVLAAPRFMARTRSKAKPPLADPSWRLDLSTQGTTKKSAGGHPAAETAPSAFTPARKSV